VENSKFQALASSCGFQPPSPSLRRQMALLSAPSASGKETWNFQSQRVQAGEGIGDCGSSRERCGLSFAGVMAIFKQFSGFATYRA
jgi:hypothetical protein